MSEPTPTPLLQKAKPVINHTTVIECQLFTFGDNRFYFPDVFALRDKLVYGIKLITRNDIAKSAYGNRVVGTMAVRDLRITLTNRQAVYVVDNLPLRILQSKINAHHTIINPPIPLDCYRCFITVSNTRYIKDKDVVLLNVLYK